MKVEWSKRKLSLIYYLFIPVITMSSLTTKNTNEMPIKNTNMVIVSIPFVNGFININIKKTIKNHRFSVEVLNYKYCV